MASYSGLPEPMLASSGRYVPGGRGWIKAKNRDYWRYEVERESAIRRSMPKTL